MGKIAMKWGEMNASQRARHQRLVGYIAREMNNGMTIEQIARANGYTLESVRRIVEFYHLA